MKRWIGALAGITLAAIGTVALVRYVDDARAEARADEEMVEVLVVTKAVSRSTPVADLGDRVALTDVPSRLVANDAVTDLASIDPTLVTATDLLPGDQVRSGRFIDPRLVTRVPVPDGYQEVTVALDPERALGGSVVVGDVVGLYASFSPPAVGATDTQDSVPVPSDTCTLGSRCLTDAVLHRVLVTGVQFGNDDAQAVQDNAGADGADVAKAPTNKVLVTLAVDAVSASKVIFASEFGSVWLTLENDGTDVSDTPLVDLDTIFGGSS